MSKHTPGPWRWVLNEKSRDVHLEGGDPAFDLIVVDFVRYGMGNAAPRFREDVDRMNIMHRCEKFGAIVPKREHHADWFKDINHPDARLIAAAPDLLEALQALYDFADDNIISALREDAVFSKARAAIAKATAL
jgi:hypothetical protein